MMEAIRDSMVSGVQPGDVVVAEGFVDMLGLFPVHQGTYTPGALKGNTRRVVVPMREPFGKRYDFRWLLRLAYNYRGLAIALTDYKAQSMHYYAICTRRDLGENHEIGIVPSSSSRLALPEAPLADVL